jgi:hypothetical protein
MPGTNFFSVTVHRVDCQACFTSQACTQPHNAPFKNPYKSRFSYVSCHTQHIQFPRPASTPVAAFLLDSFSGRGLAMIPKYNFFSYFL